MRKIRYGFVALWLLACPAAGAAQVSIGIGLPNVSIGINLPLFPELVRVPGYPVYYAPRVDANYFFYDGMYWVYQADNWYASSWYNGPWWLVEPDSVPLFILRIPVRYYRQPPVYFRGWRANAPPHWGEHWGHAWEQRRRGWDKWKRGSAPAPAPLPVYQRRYTGDRYPRAEQQQMLRNQNYRYQPRDKAVRQRFQQPVEQRGPAPAQRGRQEEQRMNRPGRQDVQRPEPIRQGGPAGPGSQPPHRGGENIQRPAPVRPNPQPQNPEIRDQRQRQRPEQHERQAPGQDFRQQRPQERGGEPQERRRGQGEGRGRDEERGR